MTNFHYVPPPTIGAFMRSKKLVRAVVGPLGSGKTTGCLFEILRRCVEQQPTKDGVRPTRWAVIRNTLPNLRQTTLPDMNTYYGDLMHYKVSESKVELRFDLRDGTRVEADILLLPLEDTEDIRKLRSLQLTGAFVEEFREVKFAILGDLIGRIGRYPRVEVPPTWQGIIMSSNPYPEGSEWYNYFEVERPDDAVLYRQPGGMDPNAENIENLPPDYYERLCAGMPQSFIDVAVHGKNGQDQSGAVVFAQSFDWRTHTHNYISPIEGKPFLIGLDTDRNPAAIIAQTGMVGELRILREVFGEGIGLEVFIQHHLTPIMQNEYPGAAHVICDPSAVKRSSITEESQEDAIRRLGYNVTLAGTKRIAPRLRGIEHQLLSATQGIQMMAISRPGCPFLIQAFTTDYKFQRSTKGELALEPAKTHPASDLMDALGYLCQGFHSTRAAFGSARSRPQMPPAPSRRAWT